MTEYATPGLCFSEPANGNAALQKVLADRGDLLDSIPGIPAVLNALLEELSQPPENVDLGRVVELVGRDESLAAQCLRVANSALFALRIPTDSLRGAVRTLGIGHTFEVAVSCTMMRIGGAQRALDPIVFWEHSLACAILSRKVARSVGFDDAEKAYLAGLLHDLGYVVNLVLVPNETLQVIERCSREGVFMAEAEYQSLGFTHCQSGEVLARKWNFSSDVVEAIRCHHHPAAAVIHPALVAIVSLADRLCRASGLGFGYVEKIDPTAGWESDWAILVEKCPLAAEMQWSDFVAHSYAYLNEVRELVKAMYQKPS